MDFPLDEPPPYEDAIELKPFTSSRTLRDRLPRRVHGIPRRLDIPVAFNIIRQHLALGPPGWHEYAHFAGYRYYSHSHLRVITRSDPNDPRTLNVIHLAIGILNARRRLAGLVLPTCTELVLEVHLTYTPPIVKYYYVDHARHILFWLEATTTEQLGCPPVTDYTQLHLLLRQYYWEHVEEYPMHMSLSDDVEQRLIRVLEDVCSGNVTTLPSRVPFSRDQCETYLHLLRHLPTSDVVRPYRNSILTRLWREIDQTAFLEFGRSSHPAHRALIHGPSRTAMTYITKWIWACVLLGAGGWNGTILSEMCRNRYSNEQWLQFLVRMTNEWRLFAFRSMVMLVVSCIALGLSVANPPLSCPWAAAYLKTSTSLAFILSLFGIASSVSLSSVHVTLINMRQGDYVERYLLNWMGPSLLSFVYAAPEALVLWPSILLTTSTTVYASDVVIASFGVTVFVLITFTLVLVAASNTKLRKGKIGTIINGIAELVGGCAYAIAECGLKALDASSPIRAWLKERVSEGKQLFRVAFLHIGSCSGILWEWFARDVGHRVMRHKFESALLLAAAIILGLMVRVGITAAVLRLLYHDPVTSFGSLVTAGVGYRLLVDYRRTKSVVSRTYCVRRYILGLWCISILHPLYEPYGPWLASILITSAVVGTFEFGDEALTVVCAILSVAILISSTRFSAVLGMKRQKGRRGPHPSEDIDTRREEDANGRMERDSRATGRVLGSPNSRSGARTRRKARRARVRSDGSAVDARGSTQQSPVERPVRSCST